MKNWFRRRDRAGEIHDEIESHLAMRAEWNRSRGAADDAAQSAARRQFGNAALVEEEVRRVRGFPWLESLAQDARFALRGFRRSPVFTATAVLTIALGIGATTAVFSLVDRILFRPLPYPDAGRLVSVGLMAPSVDKSEFVFADAYVKLRAQQTVFSQITTFGFISDCDLTGESAARVQCAQVESTFLPTFGIQPALGRNFTHVEDQPNAPKVALLSYPFWKSRFGGDAGAVGRTVAVDGRPVNIVGVLPRDFELFNLTPFDLLMPEAINEAHPGNGRLFRAFARLKPGVSIDGARAALQSAFERERAAVPPQFRRELHLVIRPLRERQIGSMRIASWTLFAAVLVVLLIASANVANLMLARSAGRRQEWTIRAAIGASRGRLARQVLTESLLLAGLGAAAGCGLAWLLLRFFVLAAPHGIPRLDQASLDGRVLLFAVALALLSGVTFGFAPAMDTPEAGSMAAGRTVASGRGVLRHLLIAAQIAASLILLTGAGLLLRSLWNLERVPLGLDADQTVAAQFVIGRGVEELPFYERLEERLRALPGHPTFAIADNIPPYGGSRSRPFFVLDVEGRPPYPQGAGGMVGWRYITPGYFAAMGIPIIRGRAFTEEERGAREMPIVISRELASRLFPQSDPIGRHMLSIEGVWHTVVGVASDVINNGLDRHPEPEYYELRKHFADATYRNRAPSTGWRAAAVIVRSPLSPETMSKTLRGVIGGLDPAIPVTVQTLAERAGTLTVTPRFDALLLGGFAAVGLLLAAIGIYGVIAFLVGQRTREVGVRMALGATPASVTALFLRHAAGWAIAGIALGLAGSLAVTRLLASLLFRVGARDPWSLAAPALLLLAVALAAAWLPARRAARIDPVESLRAE
ncbi:MAG TPA: ABC transporter permease [Bryobacteraceae bacterium]|jgi:predicted permease|nr:ABC transporter permease [Bryobacteraceae bacterium]